MASAKAKNNKIELKMGMSLKLSLSLGAIATVLLLSSIITVMEYTKMSRYVSEGLSKDINSINVARQLSDVANEYNLDILALIGNEPSNEPGSDGAVGSALPDFDADSFLEKCDRLRSALKESNSSTLALADSVEYSFAAYMLTSLEFKEVYSSDFIDTREWYFDRLQPRYQRLRRSIDLLSQAIYEKLNNKSEDFDSGYYRSIMPGIVTAGVGLVLVLMLLFFLQFYYVRPLNRIAAALKLHSTQNRKYTVDFDGDDQLKQINDGIRSLSEDNDQLRRRITALKAGAKSE